MTPQDKSLAREALEKGWMTIDQVSACKVECEETGVPFRAIAEARGWLKRPVRAEPEPPKPPRPVPYALLLGSALGLTVTFSVVLLLAWRAGEQRRKLETAEVTKNTARLESEARLAAQRRLNEPRQKEAFEFLQTARRLLTELEEARRINPDADLEDRLKDASFAFTRYLQVFPDDAVALVERARTHELRGALQPAIDDLRRAAQSDPSLAADLNAKIRLLERFLPKRDN